MATIRVGYEGDEYPEDASPAWTRSTNSYLNTRILDNRLFRVQLGTSAYELYTRTEKAFKKGEMSVKLGELTGTTPGQVLFGFHETVSDQYAAVRISEVREVTLLCGGQSVVALADDTDLETDFVEYRLAMLTIGGGFPKLHLWRNGTLLATLTSDVVFTPQTPRFNTSTGAPLGGIDVSWDYLRYKLGGAGSRNQRTGGIGMLPDVKKVLEEKEEPKPMYATFPADGGTESVAAGDLLLNFEDGSVRMPNGTEKKLSNKLEGSEHEYMRAIFIDNPDQDIKMNLDGMGWFTVEANTLRGVIFQPFLKCHIRTTTTTSLKIFASTDARGGIVAA